jgi:hypothetical protein
MLISSVLLRRVSFCLNCGRTVIRRHFRLYVKIVFEMCLSSILIIPLWFHASSDSIVLSPMTALNADIHQWLNGYRQFCIAASGAECSPLLCLPRGESPANTPEAGASYSDRCVNCPCARRQAVLPCTKLVTVLSQLSLMANLEAWIWEKTKGTHRAESQVCQFCIWSLPRD